MKTKEKVFVEHIEQHLDELGLKDVRCKICEKTIDEIYEAYTLYLSKLE